MGNLKLAFRTLFRTPFVTGTAIVSLALGIGANVAIFSLFERALLRELPVHEPGELVNLVDAGPKPGSSSTNAAGGLEAIFSYPMFRDLEAAETRLAGVAAHRAFGANVAYQGETLSGSGLLVSGSYFPLLGVRPALGRLLARSDDERPGAHHVAVLSHSFWEGRLGADPTVVGNTILVNGESMTIVGVAARGFEGTTAGVQPLVFVPITLRQAMWPGSEVFDNRSNYWVYAFGRLKPDVSIEAAETAINAVYRPIIHEVETPLQPSVVPEWMLAEFREKQITLTDGRRGQRSFNDGDRVALVLLFAITGTVLVIACANIANLLLVRGADRSMEIAIRLSLGEPRRRILTQLLTESCLLAVLGGAASLLVAHWTLAAISSLYPPRGAVTLQFQLRPVVMMFAGALALGTGLLTGLFPALQSTRLDLLSTIRTNAGSIVGGQAAARLRSGLVTAQVALSMALLIAAGLFVKSLINVYRIDLGIEAEGLVTFRISPQLSGYEPERSRALIERLGQELSSIPGVTGVASSTVPLLGNDNYGSDAVVEGPAGTRVVPEVVDGGGPTSYFNEVGPGYFRTLGIPLIAGREFTPNDVAETPNVAVVNEAFAEKFGLGRDAVGKRMGTRRDGPLDMQIIGLVANAKYSGVKPDVPPLFFTPNRQAGNLNFYVRSSLRPEEHLRSVREVMARLDPNLPVENLKTMSQQIRDNVVDDRFLTTLSAAFAALATVLAAVGLYGVLAYAVAQRTREIGVRMALGADGRRVRRMVLRQVARMFLIGGVIGTAGALALGRMARSLLFGIDAHDPVVIATAALTLALFALAAGYVPALRASRIVPMQALRYE